MNIKKPLHNQVIIKQQDESESRYGSIILPDMGRERPLLGIVVATGPGAWDPTGTFKIEMSVQVGDIVLFPSFGPIKFSLGSEEYIACKDADLITTLE